jgi:hypothetical protein
VYHILFNLVEVKEHSISCQYKSKAFFSFDGWYEVGWPEQVSGLQGECPNKTFGNLT